MKLKSLPDKLIPGILLATFGILTSAFSNAAYSAVVVTQRDTVENLSFSDQSAFTDASLSNSSTLSLSGSIGDTKTLTWTVPDGATNFQVINNTPTDYSVSSPTLTAGSPNSTESFTITALNGSPGSVSITSNLGVNLAPSDAEHTLLTGVSGNGYNYLEEIFNPTANQVIGNLFNFEVIINGNYSAVGDTSGSHELININSGWTIDQNFVFNGTDTIFAAHISNYELTDQINLQYQLYGAAVTPVPIPAAIWLFGSTIVGFIGLNRRKTIQQ